MPYSLNINCLEALPENYTNDLTVTIATPIQPGVNAAPAPVLFYASSVTGCLAGDPGGSVIRDPKFHQLMYVWDFGDLASMSIWNAASLLNTPTVWKNRNKAYGPNVAHVYNAPGTYTVTLTVYEPETRKKGTASVEVTIGDPRLVFSTNKTIIYNPASLDISSYGWTGAQNISSWSTVITQRNNLGTTPAQILLAPGVNLTTTSINNHLINDRPWGNIRLGALDPTNRPTITCYKHSAIRDYNTTNYERVCFDIDFVGDWDSTTESGHAVAPFIFFGNTSATHFLNMNHRCTFNGFSVVGSGVGSTAPSYIVNNECNVTNWQNYGCTSSRSGAGSRTHYIACSIAQHVDALSGGSKDTTFYNNHGPLRDFNSSIISISICDMFSRNGWSNSGSSVEDGIALTADQPCIRLNTNGDSGPRGYVERVSMEGDIGLEEQDSNNTDRPGNYVFEKIFQVVTPRSIYLNEIRYGGVTFRNIVSVITPGARPQSNAVSEAFILDNTDGTPKGAILDEDNDQGIDIAYNTIVDLRTTVQHSGSMSLFSQPALETNQFLNKRTENNILYRPNINTPSIPYSPLDMSTNSGFTIRHKGPRVGFLSEYVVLASPIAQNDTISFSYSDIKTTRQNQDNVDTGLVTDQTYWLLHGGTKHKICVYQGSTYVVYHYEDGDFDVDFNAGEILITNLQANTWPTGWTLGLKLDRSSALPPWDPKYDYRGCVIPFAYPLTGSTARTGGNPINVYAYDDFFGFERVPYGDTVGAFLPRPAGTRRTVDSVTVGTLSGYDLPLTIESDGDSGDIIRWMIARTGSVSGLSATERENAILSGVIPGGVGAIGAKEFDSNPIVLPKNIPFNTDYVIMVLVDNGSSGSVGTSSTFTVDTTSPILSAESFTDGGGENLSYSFQTDENCDFRLTTWTKGSVPSQTVLGSGVGSIATTTGTTAAGVAETGSFAVGDGNWTIGLWVRDSLGNVTTKIYPTVAIAAADVRTTDPGVLYWFASDDTALSGTDVTAINDKRGGFDLNTKPAAFSYIQQASSTDPMVFNTNRLLQTPDRVIGNSKIMTHLKAGGSNSLRVFLVVDAADFGTGSAVHFSESSDSGVNNAAWFGGYRVGSNIAFHSQIRGAAGNGLSSSATTTAVNYTTTGLCILEWLITQSTWDIFINGVDVGGGTVNPANFPASQAVRVTLGALASDTALQVGTSAIGDFREVYITTTADDITANNIRITIADQWGIIL